jgi:hypothetical protein
MRHRRRLHACAQTRAVRRQSCGAQALSRRWSALAVSVALQGDAAYTRPRLRVKVGAGGEHGVKCQLRVEKGGRVARSEATLVAVLHIGTSGKQQRRTIARVSVLARVLQCRQTDRIGTIKNGAAAIKHRSAIALRLAAAV